MARHGTWSDKENPLRKFNKIHNEQINPRTLELIITRIPELLTCHS